MFLKDALIRKFGEEFYEALDATAVHHLRESRITKTTAYKSNLNDFKIPFPTGIFCRYLFFLPAQLTMQKLIMI